MLAEGGIVLGIGGDNSDKGIGTYLLTTFSFLSCILREWSFLKSGSFLRKYTPQESHRSLPQLDMGTGDD